MALAPSGTFPTQLVPSGTSPCPQVTLGKLIVPGFPLLQPQGAASFPQPCPHPALVKSACIKCTLLYSVWGNHLFPIVTQIVYAHCLESKLLRGGGCLLITVDSETQQGSCPRKAGSRPLVLGMDLGVGWAVQGGSQHLWVVLSLGRGSEK